jgi:hypothetical protein
VEVIVSESTRENRNEIFGASSAQSAGLPTRNIMRDDFGMEIPVESVPLPSAGLIYPADSPLSGRETVDIRAMTAKEEDILTSRALIKKGTVITELLKSCLVDKNIDPDSLISGDRNAIMTAVRITGYGSDYTVDIDCPACSEKSKQNFKLTELGIKRLEIEPVEIGKNLFEFKLPVSGKTIRFKFLTGKDEQEITVTAERKRKQGQQSDNLITQKLMYSVVAVDGTTDKVKVQSFIRNMPARDSLSLRKFMDANEPGIDMKSWIECPNCDESSEVRLPLGVSFFWPDN